MVPPVLGRERREIQTEKHKHRQRDRHENKLRLTLASIRKPVKLLRICSILSPESSTDSASRRWRSPSTLNHCCICRGGGCKQLLCLLSKHVLFKQIYLMCLILFLFYNNLPLCINSCYIQMNVYRCVCTCFCVFLFTSKKKEGNVRAKYKVFKFALNKSRINKALYHKHPLSDNTRTKNLPKSHKSCVPERN